MNIENGEMVVLVLQNPRERILGVLGEISASGVFVRGIELDYFDEWVMAINNGEPYLPMQDVFYPMWRVERLTKDAAAGGAPSMAELFTQRTGKPITEF